MTHNRSLPSRARWTLTALLALSLLPACLGAQSMGTAAVEFVSVKQDSDIDKLPATTSAVSVLGTSYTAVAGRKLAQLTQLTNLEFQWTGVKAVSADFLREAVKCKSLKELFVAGGENLRDADFGGLAGLQNLFSLQLAGLSGITVETLKSAAKGGKLSCLVLTGCTAIAGAAALKTIGTLPLKTMMLKKSPINLASLEFSPSSSLTYLSLIDVEGINDALLENIAKKMTVEQLVLRGTGGSTPGITDKGVAALGALPGLRRLYIGGASKLTDAAAATLAAMPGLCDLTLAGGKSPAAKLTSKGALMLLASDNLTFVSLAEQTKLTLEVPADFKAGAKLMRFNLSKTAFDDKALLAMAGKLDQLDCVFIHGCAKVTQKGIDKLKAAHPKLYVDLADRNQEPF
ncbi:MAG: hypothetical protein IT462_13045 [Planctomycetes bacterium]|nr:hypothetical protein [Planctomycetota bacterium]